MSDPASARVVILGAGHAGGAAAALLRQYGHQGAITLVGDEAFAPYQRPPLSKAWLKGEADVEGLTLKPVEFYSQVGIDFRPNVRATRIRREARLVELETGSSLPYDRLILATGMRARRLEAAGSDLSGVLSLRNIMDAQALKTALGASRRLAIVGGGYVGLEVAASARTLGCEVVVVEREARLLARSASDTLAEFLQSYHTAHGVRFELQADIRGFEGEAGRITGLILAGGKVVPCDAVLVGVGGLPNEEIAVEAGLDTDSGVIVDDQARTSDPNIFAIGDVTRRPVAFYGRTCRLESVPSALEQARQAAAVIAGRATPPAEIPWNWSDQYDLKLQMVGLPFDVDEVLLRGDPSTGRFALFHLRGEHVQAVEAVNAAPEVIVGKRLIVQRSAISKARLADMSVSMKDVAMST